MKNFMDKDFLLSSETAKKLFHEYAETMPIIDYHCHLSPAEILGDKKYRNITELWLGGDHYKWRAMRSNGVDEYYITGEASDYEKFEKWAEVMPKLIGNPLYHWTHLELQRYFDVYEPLSPATCADIWERCNKRLETLSARKCIELMDVKYIYTTDDPCDTLEHHAALAKEDTSFKMLPAWRPDKAVNIDKAGFTEYIGQLSKVCGFEINDFDALKKALAGRLEHFHALGCRNSDHGLDYVVSEDTAYAEVAFTKVLNGGKISKQEADSYKTALLLWLSAEYTRLGWVMQLHYGAVRNVNPVMYAKLGPDTGYDAIWGGAESGLLLGGLLGRMEAEGHLPKTIIYSLNPIDNAQIGTIIGCFQNSEAQGKIQQGCAWWFNDSLKGMREQLTSLASLSVLGNFVGMVTDSRSFLSYTRHEYFRRIICELLGAWVENGEYPDDFEALGEMVRGICYNNAVNFFSLEK
ncbi:MAG: glucuronate isomerase [Oscillospiraceae bacterium]|nr:glucuronate isomerase [Oscillospiraceae bacterium]